MNTTGHDSEYISGGVADTTPIEDFSQLGVKLDVIASIAGKATLEVDGVVSIDGGLSGGLAAALKRDVSPSGVKVVLEDNSLTINVNVIAKYGARIPEVAWNLQEHVKRVVEGKVGINVQKVNVLIAGIKDE